MDIIQLLKKDHQEVTRLFRRFRGSRDARACRPTVEKICQEQKLRELPRMGAKLEEKVLRSIAAYRQRAGRYLLRM